MKNLLFIFLALLILSSCAKESTEESVSRPIDTLQGTISADKVLDVNTDYVLKGQVYVKNNASLTIPAGVIVSVVKNTEAASKSALIVTRGSKLNINGTADKPVVFTSAAASKAPGDWIGIIVLGAAPTNGTGGLLNIMGFASSADTQFGGTSASDNSGSITYLRMEYCGGLNADLEEEWEWDKASGLSLDGVGSGTKVENVMVRYSNDDSFQFVGGNVNAKYLIGYNSGDDDFDFDRGYTGKLQFLISYRTKPSTHAIRANGMESLNDKGATDVTPFTRPIISNMTILGPQANTADADQSQGIYIRRNTRFNVRNSIIAEYTDGGLMLCPKTKPLLIENKGSEFKYNLVHADVKANAFTYDDGPTGVIIGPDPQVAGFAIVSDDGLIVRTAVNKNTIVDSSSDLKLKGIYAADSPDLSLADGSVALTGANFTNVTTSPDFTSPFFTVVEYRGAVGKDNWAVASNWAVWK